MDLSDGLADGVDQMAEASGVGMTIDAAALPIDPGRRAPCSTRGGEDPVVEALTGGDDYELLFAVRPRTQRRLARRAAARRRHADAHRRAAPPSARHRAARGGAT